MPYIYNSSLATNHKPNKQVSSLNNKNDTNTEDSGVMNENLMSPSESTELSTCSPATRAQKTPTTTTTTTFNTTNRSVNVSGSGGVNSAHQFIIPTRFIDRRVSTSVTNTDPYKFNVNYSEAGQRLARKAQEQLKSKDNAADSVSSSNNNNNSSISSQSGRRNSNDHVCKDGNEFEEDWQYVSILFV
jgi:hypothetical protein